MRTITAFLLAVALCALSGCNGARFVAQHMVRDPYPVTVSERMRLVQTRTVREKAVYNGPHGPESDGGAHIRTRAELYVERPGDMSEAFCYVGRQRLIAAGEGWADPAGRPFTWDGAAFHERFRVVLTGRNRAEDGELLKFIGLDDREFSRTGYVLYRVVRNLTDRERLEVIYGVDISVIPLDFLRRASLLEYYMRSRFVENVRFS